MTGRSFITLPHRHLNTFQSFFPCSQQIGLKVVKYDVRGNFLGWEDVKGGTLQVGSFCRLQDLTVHPGLGVRCGREGSCIHFIFRHISLCTMKCKERCALTPGTSHAGTRSLHIRADKHRLQHERWLEIKEH